MIIPGFKEIRDRRMKLEISQKKMAEMCGILASALNQYEKGSQELSHKKWVTLVETIYKKESENSSNSDKTLGKICNRKIKAETVSRVDSLYETHEKMKKTDFDQLLVSERDETTGKKEIIGIIFNTDIAYNWKYRSHKKVQDVMTNVPIYDVNDLVSDEILRVIHLRRCILVSKNNKVVGIATSYDLLY